MFDHNDMELFALIAHENCITQFVNSIEDNTQLGSVVLKLGEPSVEM